MYIDEGSILKEEYIAAKTPTKRVFLAYDGWYLSLTLINIISIYSGALKYQDTISIDKLPGNNNDFVISRSINGDNRRVLQS